MQLSARIVLSDAYKAWQLLEAEADPERFRILWVSAIALCRSVGHVLDKVDGQRHPEVAGIQKQLWSEKRNETIFREFIDLERNDILKEYFWNLETGPVNIVVTGADESDSLYALGECLFCPIQDGEYVGEDCRDILLEALQWWDSFLSEIERAS